MNLHELQLPENYQQIVSRFLAACQADERIVAAFLGGSYARHEADEFSDLDLFFVTTDEAYDAFLAEKESFARRMGEPLFLDDFGVPYGYCFILSDGSEGEFWFGRARDIQDIYSGPYKVLLDKKNVLSGQPFPMRTADQARQVVLLRRQVDWFWHELAHFIKALGRRQLWFAYGQLEAMRRTCIILARLDHDFSDPYLEETEPHFKIEQFLPAEKLSPLQAAFCAMEYDAMLQAAQVLCGFYQDAAPRLAKAHNLPYQHGLERILVEKLRALGRD